MFQLVGYFIGGLVGLWLGAELITRSAQTIARILGLSEVFIGLTILAIGTDFPEIMVAFTGAMEKRAGVMTDEIIVGNVIGSNMGQISLIFGIAGLMKVLKMKKKETLPNGIMVLLSSVLLLLVSLDGMLSITDGVIFLVLYLFYFLTLEKKNKLSKIKKRLRVKKKKPIMPLILLAIGLFILTESSHLVLENGIRLAEISGVSQLLIGIVLVGIGTSLPELVVSVNAVVRGSDGLSVGNLIGSNIVDILISLGASALLGGWEIKRSVVMFDLPYLIFTTTVVVLFLLTKEKLERKESALILALYIVYLVLKFNGW